MSTLPSSREMERLVILRRCFELASNLPLGVGSDDGASFNKASSSVVRDFGIAPDMRYKRSNRIKHDICCEPEM